MEGGRGTVKDERQAVKGFWLCSTIVSIVIFLLSAAPVPDVPQLEDVPFFDKWVHFVMYASFTFAMWLDWWRNMRWEMPSVRVIISTFVIPALWGGLMELVQMLLPYRSGDWMDALANSFGAFLGVIVSLTVWKIIEKISAAK